MTQISTTPDQDDPSTRFPLDVAAAISDAALIRLCDEYGQPIFDWRPRSEPPVSVKPTDRLALQIGEHEPNWTTAILTKAQPATFEGVWIGTGGVSSGDLTAIADHRTRELCLGPWWWDSSHCDDVGLQLPADPAVFAVLRYLDRLEVNRAEFSDDHLHAVGVPGRMRSLAFTRTRVTGSGVAAGRFSSVTQLRLAEDPAVSQDLTFLRSLPMLRSLALRASGLRDEHLSVLGVCPTIQSLDLTRNPVGETSLTQLRALPHLRTLDLSHTETTDETVGSLDACPSLRNLWLAGTRLTDAAVAKLGRLRRLECLWLTGTNITDQGLVTLVQVLPQLRRLDISMTNVTASGAQQLRHLRNLVRLEISPAAIDDALVETLATTPSMCEVGLRGPGDADAIWSRMATIADTIGGAQYLGRV